MSPCEVNVQAAQRELSPDTVKGRGCLVPPGGACLAGIVGARQGTQWAGAPWEQVRGASAGCRVPGAPVGAPAPRRVMHIISASPDQRGFAERHGTPSEGTFWASAQEERLMCITRPRSRYAHPSPILLPTRTDPVARLGGESLLGRRDVPRAGVLCPRRG
jgi:hypothetical protein